MVTPAAVPNTRPPSVVMAGEVTPVEELTAYNHTTTPSLAFTAASVPPVVPTYNVPVVDSVRGTVTAPARARVHRRDPEGDAAPTEPLVVPKYTAPLGSRAGVDRMGAPTVKVHLGTQPLVNAYSTPSDPPAYTDPSPAITMPVSVPLATALYRMPGAVVGPVVVPWPRWEPL